MTSLDKAIAQQYVLNPLQTQQQIADAVGCARESVCKALVKEPIQKYIDELSAEQWKKARAKAMKQMCRIMEQDNNLALKYKASEFILKSFGIGNETKITVDSNEINIKIKDEN